MLKLKQIIPGVLAPLSFAVVSSVQAATVNLDGNGNVTSINNLEVCLSGTEICAKTRPELEQDEIKIIDFYNVTFTIGSFNVIFGDPTGSDFDTSCESMETNKLCFWENEAEAVLAIGGPEEITNEEGEIEIVCVTGINCALDALDPIPPLIAPERADFPPEPVPNTRNFYRVPVNFGDLVDGEITYYQGTNNNLDPDNSWALDTRDSNSTTSALPYAGFEFLRTQTIRPLPPDTPNVPEPSSLMGIVFTFGSMLMAIKKKN